MIEKKLFCCEKCGRSFNEFDECANHEKDCNKNIPVKGIFINAELLFDKQLEIKILEWPHAILHDNKIKLTSSNDIFNSVRINPDDLEQIQCGTVNEIEDFYTIYTTDFSKEHEDKCIKDLLEKRKNDLQEALNERIKTFEKNIKVINDKKYVVKTYKDSVLTKPSF